MAEITMLTVANSAEIMNGNLYGLGIGWNWTTSPAPPMVLIARTNISQGRMDSGDMTWTCELQDSDGRPVNQPIQPNSLFYASATMPNGSYPGVEVPVWSLFYFPVLELPPGRYQWRVSCDDAVKEYGFTVVDPASLS